MTGGEAAPPPSGPKRAPRARIAAALETAEASLARLSRRLRRVPYSAALLLSLAAGAAASAALGTDRNWDLLNYHLYNPLALLTDRGGDIAPPGAQVFFNPAADLPFFWLLQTLNEHPAAIAALMGLPAGAAAYLVMLLSRLVLRGAGVGPPRLLAVLAAAGAATGANFRSQIGTTHNDLLTAVPLLAALLLALRAALSPRPPPTGTLLLAGALAGAAVGLKLTNAPFAVGLGAALAAGLWAGRRPTARPLALLLGGGALGFGLAAGPWMLRLWQDWGNPFFPFFDALFAAGRPPSPIGRDPRFLPQGALEWLFYPFTWALSDRPRSSETEMRDPRIALAFLALLALAAGARRSLARPAVAFLAAFLAVSYLLWLAVFSIYRYALVLEALSPLLALVAAAALPARRRRAGLAGLLLVAGSAAATDPPALGRAPLGPRYLDAALPELPPGALLLLRRDEPLAYLAAVAPPGTRFAGLSAVAQFGPSSPVADRLRRALEGAPPSYVLAPELDGAAEAAAASGLRLETRSCRRVCTNWTSGGVGPLVCPAADVDGGAFPPAPTHRGPRANTVCGMVGAGITLGGRRGPRVHREPGLIWPPEGCRRLRLTHARGGGGGGETGSAGESRTVIVLPPGRDWPLEFGSEAGDLHLRAAECIE